jgi:hypothetical protein
MAASWFSNTPDLEGAPPQKLLQEFFKRILGNGARIAIFAFEEFPHDSDEIPNFRA